MPPFWQYGLPNVSDDLAAFAMMNGTTPGSPERGQMIVDTVRRQRDRRGWSRNPLLDPTREADEEAARLREAADAIRHHQGGRGTTLDVPRHAAIESNARIRAGGDDSSSPPPPQWRRWTVWAFIATGPCAALVAFARSRIGGSRVRSERTFLRPRPIPGRGSPKRSRARDVPL